MASQSTNDKQPSVSQQLQMKRDTPQHSIVDNMELSSVATEATIPGGYKELQDYGLNPSELSYDNINEHNILYRMYQRLKTEGKLSAPLSAGGIIYPPVVEHRQTIPTSSGSVLQILPNTSNTGNIFTPIATTNSEQAVPPTTLVYQSATSSVQAVDRVPTFNISQAQRRLEMGLTSWI